MTPWAMLDHLKTALATVSGVASCQIGLEANITPADYPLVRIVPTRMRPNDDVGDRALLEVTVYFGDALLESADGLETVYEGLFALESQIRQAVLFGAVRAAWAGGARMAARYVETLFDEDRLPHYKMMASRFEVEGG
jgi:hypothetical protein